MDLKSIMLNNKSAREREIQMISLICEICLKKIQQNKLVDRIDSQLTEAGVEEKEISEINRN